MEFAKASTSHVMSVSGEGGTVDGGGWGGGSVGAMVSETCHGGNRGEKGEGRGGQPAG